MERLTLLHLTFVGPGVVPATVEFGPKLTVVRGPSDTGKSYIADSIDFMLGASALKEIPERDGYDTVLLGIHLPDGKDVTLARAVQGGAFRLLRGDHRTNPLPAGGDSLSATHDKKKTDSVSRYVLGKIGLDGKVVRKDGAGRTISLSLRKLLPFFLVNETKIQARTPPVETGQHADRTGEISTFRLLLQGEDDSALEPNESPTERRRSKAAKHDVIDKLLAEARRELKTDETLEQVTERIGRLRAAIAESTGTIEQTAAARQQWGHHLSNSERLVTAGRRSIAELDALDARFALLHDQYTSDLDRLDAVGEAGSLLGYFTPGRCVFCGAEPEHQHLNADCTEDTTAFSQSVREEQRKTTALREDLLQAIAGLRDERAGKAERLQNYTGRAAEAAAQIARLDSLLNPRQHELRDLLATATQLERDADTIRRVQRLEALRSEVTKAPKPKPIKPTAGLQRSAVDALSHMIASRLRAWGFHDADSASYSFAEQDVVSGNQLRTAHGKGVRAVLHAAFTISLAQYCFDNNLPHPGVVVLDSPLVVYRPPDPGAEPDDSGSVLDTTSLASRFFADVHTNFSGQIIILENEDLPDSLGAGWRDITFTKNIDRGRYGLFPHPRSR
ncbi:hypothetical protein V5P93_002298 [Actinokineospora auranticolor]|uniref:AAA domain-containing protein n=1 Tax=Actinokineospora auranticolor TaxID=155976 RepID=A0A2S6GDK8_9PSEU|nr:hypothetical protein [Actinokineospora auranticolor]PPK63327.1 hypothetical protein CLV40_12940 [Actinokineospora auranticolor]